jgi:hypothetical protein
MRSVNNRLVINKQKIGVLLTKRPQTSTNQYPYTTIRGLISQRKGVKIEKN